MIETRDFEKEKEKGKNQDIQQPGDGPKLEDIQQPGDIQHPGDGLEPLDDPEPRDGIEPGNSPEPEDGIEPGNSPEPEDSPDQDKNQEDKNLPPFYFDKDDETYKQIKVLVKFCKENIDKIRFEDKDKEVFSKFLDLFNNDNKNNYQSGGGMARYIKIIGNAFKLRSNKANLNEAITTMENYINSNFNIEENIENNIVYNFANAIGFEENNTSNLSIDYEKYNKFIKYYNIFDYEEYTKNITVKFENNFFDFFQNKNILSLIEKLIKKYNDTRFNIFKKYIILKVIDEEKANQEVPPAEISEKQELNSNEKELFILSFYNKKFKSDKDFPNVNNIKDYIENIQVFFKNEIKKIIKLLKEYILKNEKLIKFDDENSNDPQEQPEEQSKKLAIGGKKYKKSKNYKRSKKYKHYHIKHHNIKHRITVKKIKNKRSRKRH